MRKLPGMLLLVIWLSGCSLSALRQPAPTPLIHPSVNVSARTIAKAMQEDSFFSQYGQDVLNVDGVVAGVTAGSGAGESRIQLVTYLPMKVICVTTADTSQIKTGDTIVVRSANAARGDSAVILNQCTIMP